MDRLKRNMGIPGLGRSGGRVVWSVPGGAEAEEKTGITPINYFVFSKIYKVRVLVGPDRDEGVDLFDEALLFLV